MIHRISGDAPKDILVAPKWNVHKMWILHGFEKDLWVEICGKESFIPRYKFL